MLSDLAQAILDFVFIFRVCSRWRQLLKSEIFWKRVRHTPTSHGIIKLIPYMPSYVTYLKLTSGYYDVPLTYHQIISKLDERCPSLKTMILDGFNLANVCHSYPYRSENSVSYNDGLIEQIIAEQQMNVSLIRYIQEKYEKENSECFKAALPQLNVLCLQDFKFLLDDNYLYSDGEMFFSYSHFLSHVAHLKNVTVLVLTDSEPMGEIDSDDVFPAMPHLQELYLQYWRKIHMDNYIRHFIETAKQLRVLGLEDTQATESTVYALQQIVVI